MTHLLRVVASVLGLAAISRAGTLEFAPKDLDVGAIFGDSPKRISFMFRNTGAKPVRVVGTHTACGCTSVESPVNAYAPGAGGELAVEFNPEGRYGVQKKTVVVTTDEPEDPVYYLTFTADVRPAFALSSRAVVWTGADDSPRKIVLSAEPGLTIAIKSVDSDARFVRVSERAVELGKRLEVAIAPTGLERLAATRITIEIQVEGAPTQKAVVVASRR